MPSRIGMGIEITRLDEVFDRVFARRCPATTIGRVGYWIWYRFIL
jgi:hypothetical protein